MNNNITSILKNKEISFIKKAESIMIEGMSFNEEKTYNDFKNGIQELDVIKIEEIILKTKKILYKTNFADRTIMVFNPVEVLLELMTKYNTPSIINVLSVLNESKGENGLLYNLKLNIKELDEKLNMDFFEMVVIEKKEKLFKDLISETNKYRPFDKDPELLFQLMKRKINRTKENNKEKAKIRLIKSNI
jgi:hypothetical protein